MKSPLALASLLLFGFALAPSHAAEPDVSFFRGDRGLAEGNDPLPDDLAAPGALVWKQAVDRGHSTPTVFGDSIFLTTFDGTELATVALERATGKLRWRQVAPAQRLETFHPTGSPAAATPACDAERVYSFFGSYGLLCYDHAGKLLWSKPLGPFRDEFGSGSSPILVDGKLILCEDHDLDSFLMAIDAATGRTIWQIPRDGFTRSYSTPLVWRDGDKTQLIIAGALQLVAYDPADGQRLWWTSGLARIVNTSPVRSGDLLYCSTWSPGGDTDARIAMEPWETALKQWDKDSNQKISEEELPAGETRSRYFRINLNQDDGLDQQEWKKYARIFELAQNNLVALRPGARGELEADQVVWHYNRSLPYVPSPLVYEGVVYLMKEGGVVTALDAATGKLLKQGRAQGPGAYFASPVAGDGKVYVASDAGIVSVLQAGAKWTVLSSHDLAERICATPVLRDGRIYVRTEKALYCFRKP